MFLVNRLLVEIGLAFAKTLAFFIGTKASEKGLLSKKGELGLKGDEIHHLHIGCQHRGIVCLPASALNSS